MSTQNSASQVKAKVKCSSALTNHWTKYKLNSTRCWMPRQPYDSSWIQFEVPRQVRWTGVVLQHGNGKDKNGNSFQDCRVSAFEIQFSADGHQFFKCEDGEISCPNDYEQHSHQFAHSFEGKIIRIHPLHWVNKPALRWEALFEEIQNVPTPIPHARHNEPVKPIDPLRRTGQEHTVEALRQENARLRSQVEDLRGERNRNETRISQQDLYIKRLTAELQKLGFDMHLLQSGGGGNSSGQSQNEFLLKLNRFLDSEGRRCQTREAQCAKYEKLAENLEANKVDCFILEEMTRLNQGTKVDGSVAILIRGLQKSEEDLRKLQEALREELEDILEDNRCSREALSKKDVEACAKLLKKLYQCQQQLDNMRLERLKLMRKLEDDNERKNEFLLLSIKNQRNANHGLYDQRSQELGSNLPNLDHILQQYKEFWQNYLVDLLVQYKQQKGFQDEINTEKTNVSSLRSTMTALNTELYSFMEQEKLDECIELQQQSKETTKDFNYHDEKRKHFIGDRDRLEFVKIDLYKYYLSQLQNHRAQLETLLETYRARRQYYEDIQEKRLKQRFDELTCIYGDFKQEEVLDENTGQKDHIILWMGDLKGSCEQLGEDAQRQQGQSTMLNQEIAEIEKQLKLKQDQLWVVDLEVESLNKNFNKAQLLLWSMEDFLVKYQKVQDDQQKYKGYGWQISDILKQITNICFEKECYDKERENITNEHKQREKTLKISELDLKTLLPKIEHKQQELQVLNLNRLGIVNEQKINWARVEHFTRLKDAQIEGHNFEEAKHAIAEMKHHQGLDDGYNHKLDVNREKTEHEQLHLEELQLKKKELEHLIKECKIRIGITQELIQVYNVGDLGELLGKANTEGNEQDATFVNVMNQLIQCELEEIFKNNQHHGYHEYKTDYHYSQLNEYIQKHYADSDHP